MIFEKKKDKYPKKRVFLGKQVLNLIYSRNFNKFIKFDDRIELINIAINEKQIKKLSSFLSQKVWVNWMNGTTQPISLLLFFKTLHGP